MTTSKIKREEVKIIIIFLSPMFYFIIKILEFKSINARFGKIFKENELENKVIGCQQNKYLANMVLKKKKKNWQLWNILA